MIEIAIDIDYSPRCFQLVTAQVNARMKGVSNLHRMEENTNAAVGRVEMMELMMLKREMAAELPHLRTMRSHVLGLNDRVKALEEKQNLMKQNLEISMQVKFRALNLHELLAWCLNKPSLFHLGPFMLEDSFTSGKAIHLGEFLFFHLTSRVWGYLGFTYYFSETQSS